MAKHYVNCPKCDDEFEFQLNVTACHSIEIRDEIQRCSCPFTEAELDAIRDEAAEKMNEVGGED